MKHFKHPATIIAAVALFLALGGGAAAYASGLINGSQIKNHSISAKKLTGKALKQLKGNRGPAGAPGTPGAPGAPGAPGPIGPSSGQSVYVSGPVALGAPDSDTVVASLALAAGSYVVMGNLTIYDASANETDVCYLTDSVGGVIGRSYTSTDSTNDDQQSLSIVAPLTSTGSTVDIDCLSSDGNTAAYYAHVVAIKLGSVTGTLRHSSGKTSNPTVTK